MNSPEEVFQAVNQKLASESKRLKDITATYAFILTGEGGGDYYITLVNGSGKIVAGKTDNPNVTVSMKVKDFVDMANGDLDGTMAFMSGKIQLKGDMGLAMKLQSLLSD